MSDDAFDDFGSPVMTRIERPGEHVVVDGVHVGDIVAGKVTISESASFRGEIDAPEVIVNGTLDGKVRAEILTQSSQGILRGEFVVTMARLAGNTKGLIIAETALVKKTSRVEGYVLADSWGVEPGASVRATIFAESGVSARKDLVNTARTGLARAEARNAAQPSPEPAPAPVAPEPEAIDVTPRRPVQRPVVPAPLTASVDGDLEREIRESLSPLARPPEAKAARYDEIVPVQPPAPRRPVSQEVPAISRFFRVDPADAPAGRPRII